MNSITRFLTPRVVRERTSLSEREQTRRATEERFPKPVKLGHGRNGRLAYVEAEIEEWIEQRIAARDRGEAA